MTTQSIPRIEENSFALKERILFFISGNPLSTCREISKNLNLSYNNVNRKILEMKEQGIVERRSLKYKISDSYVNYYQDLYKNLIITNNEKVMHYSEKESQFGEIFNHLADKTILEEINTKIDLYVAEKLDMWNKKVNQNTKKEISKIVSTIQETFGNRKNLRVLDIGCGTGRLTFSLSKFYDEVVGIDHNRKYIKYCRVKRDQLKLNNLKFRPAKVTSSINEFKYDVIIIGKINLHSMKNKSEIISNLKKKLNNNGIIISIELIEKAELFKFLNEFRDFNLEKYKLNRLSLIEDFTKGGFKVTSEIVEDENTFETKQEILDIYKVSALFFQPYLQWSLEDIDKLKEHLIKMVKPLVHNNDYCFIVCKK